MPQTSPRAAFCRSSGFQYDRRRIRRPVQPTELASILEYLLVDDSCQDIGNPTKDYCHFFHGRSTLLTRAWRPVSTLDFINLTDAVVHEFITAGSYWTLAIIGVALKVYLRPFCIWRLLGSICVRTYSKLAPIYFLVAGIMKF
jgi:hypothetical protein